VNLYRKIGNVIKRIQANVQIRIEYCKKLNLKTDENKIVLLDTAIASDNIGDEIIMHYIEKNIYCYFKNYRVLRIGTHTHPTKDELDEILTSKYVLMCGTNILSPKMELYSGWAFDKKLIHMKHLIMIGAGWRGYQSPSIYSKYVYRHLLLNGILHSVRDEQTKEALNKLGIHNCLNTNCPTMWGLDVKCKDIPVKKADTVVFSVTGNLDNRKSEATVVNILIKNYKHIYFWPQGDLDYNYLKDIIDINTAGIICLPRDLDSYTECLEKNETDYVGSRLHGGIHALQHGKRTIIIAVDNRAAEISRGTNLPVIKIDEIEDKLERLINSIWKTEIIINNKDINKWIASLKRTLLVH